MGVMTTSFRFAILGGVLCAAAAWACGSSDGGDGSSGGSSGQQMFADKVYPSLSTTCQECHATGKSGAPVFLGNNADVSYTAIDGFPGLIAPPSVSPLMQKGPHSGPALTDQQQQIVSDWLKQETIDRKLGLDPGVPKNLRAAFKAFGTCMDYSRWKALKLHTIAATTTENNQGTCVSCHNTGMASMWASGGTDNQGDEEGNAEMFLKLRKFPYVQRLVVGSVNNQGEFDSIQSARRIMDKGNEAQQPQANSHPRFALTQELSDNLNQFVLETISNVAANRCTMVELPDAGPDADYTPP
jgi:mono/diheme cytochrome c family protein